MPHLIIEHSSNLSVPAATLLNSLHQAAEQTQLFDPSSIKSRMLSFEHHKLGNDKEGFIHVQAHIIHGRTVEQKQLLSDMLFAQLQHHLPLQWQLSVHVYDLMPQIYRKN